LTSKDKLLGMPFGTASHRLRKEIMFSMVKELGRDRCFRCGEKIEHIDDLSIEHKSPWQSAPDPKASFFSLDNISFSHLTCNSGTGDRGPEASHGTVWRYLKYRCRCNKCKAVKANYRRQRYTSGKGRTS
jgi:hypothetical protein